jgi:hypothetical protein
MKFRHSAAIAIAALATGIGGYATFRQLDAPDMAPKVAYTLLDGQQASSDQWRGKVILVNF